MLVGFCLCFDLVSPLSLALLAADRRVCVSVQRYLREIRALATLIQTQKHTQAIGGSVLTFDTATLAAAYSLVFQLYSFAMFA